VFGNSPVIKAKMADDLEAIRAQRLAQMQVCARVYLFF
jgi:hypothetical protein